MNDRFSVLIPATGDCEFIEYTLGSINESTLQPFEILIIDDGISKKSIDAIEAFEAIAPIKLIKNSGNGLVSALNTGLLRSQTELIARLDADDRVLSERFKIQCEFLTRNTSVIAIGTQCNYINTSGDFTGLSNYPVGILNSMSEFRNQCLMAHPSVMFRKSFVLKLNGYRTVFRWENTDIGEDFDLWLRLSKLGQIVNLPLYLIEYRQHQNQLSAKNLYGQLIGTNYIAAINALEIEKPFCIDLPKLNFSKIIIMLSSIFKGLGLSVAFVTIVRIAQSHLDSIFKKKGLIWKILNKLT